MALVPFSVSGAAAAQDLEQRLMQVGPYSLLLCQRPGASSNTAHLQGQHSTSQGPGRQQLTPAAAAAAGSASQQLPDLSQVGLVLWQSGYVLSDFLLLRLQAAGGAVSSSGAAAGGWSGSNGSNGGSSGGWGGGGAGSSGSWAGVRVLELGCGGGTCGMFLALAGAQVVLTDQDHILPLTRENLDINFPATATAHPGQPPGTQASKQPDDATVALGQATDTTTHKQSNDATPQQPPALPPAHSVELQQQHHQQQPRSAAAAFEAAFEMAAPDQHQQQSQEDSNQAAAAAAAAAVFAAGPLVVQYSWGEPLQLLQDRLAAAADARLRGVPSPPPAAAATAPPPAAAAASAETPGHGSRQPTTPTATQADAEHFQSAAWQALQQSSRHIAAQGFDVVIGADLLYDPAHHTALLHSLQQLATASPHVQVYLCWRQRQLGEEAFLTAAAAAGWVIEAVPVCLLHPEFQDGCYQLVRMVHLP